jgi:serine/threonine protein phosphatase PrpC
MEGKIKTNQDACIVNPPLFAENNYNMFGVCDGHGINKF